MFDRAGSSLYSARRACFFLFFTTSLLNHPRLYAAAPPPKLIVLVVIDQMRSDYFSSHVFSAQHGLKTLKEKSSFFTQCRLDFVPTETAPGHATLVTGRPPAVTGIIGNDWFDRKLNKRVNSDEDSSGQNSPQQLMVDTIGDELKKMSPSSKIVALSFKNRAAIMLGGHHADHVVWFDKKKRKFVTSPHYSPPPKWLEKTNQELQNQIPLWPQFGFTLLTPDIDRFVWEAAQNALEGDHLGQNASTDLLLVSFSATDNIGHWYGPFSKEMTNQLQSLDKLLGEFIAYLNKRLPSQFILILTSDHGVLPMPETVEGEKLNSVRIKKRDLLHQMESAIATKHKNGPWIKDVLIPDIYFDRKKVESQKLSWSHFIEETAQLLRTVPSIAQVYTPGVFGERDAYTDVYKRSYFPSRSGDLLVRTRPGVLITHPKSGTTHGSPYDYDTWIPLLFYGENFPSIQIDSPVTLEQVVPTMREWLSLPSLKEEENYLSPASLTSYFSSQSH